MAGIIKFVATGCHADMMCLGFLRTDVADEVGLGDFVVLGDLGLLNKKYCVHAFDLFGSGASYTKAMGEELTPFICKG